jgi:2-keto-4-pentenoate hydratase/2-oxohepta-3-ene-1,7-dioic acid hydratase in catechol pathway
VELDGTSALVEASLDGMLRVLSLDGVSPIASLTQLLQSGGAVHSLATVHDIPPSQRVRWLPPLVPGKICAVAINNRSFDGSRISGPDHPAFFLKSPTSLVGHGEAVILREQYGLTHPEPELAVIIGKRASRVREEDAMSFVFGYSILNDITSVRMRNEDHFNFRFEMPDGAGGFANVEQHTSYAGRYKGADTFGPLGPVIVTRDEISDPDDLGVRCWLDGELVQSDRTSSYRYSVARVVSFISQFDTLLPGDVVSMGTAVSGAGGAIRPLSSLDLRAGVGAVTVEIEGIGTLRNPVTIEA